jgi:chromate reductase
MAKVIGLSGSLRGSSCNTGLLRAAQRFLGKNHGVTLTIVPIGALPLFNQDVEKAALPAVSEFRAALEPADGFLLATCEYNSSVSAALKNAIDWGSRGKNLFNNKAAAIIGAGGYAGTTRAQGHLRDIASAINMHTLTHPEVRVEIFKDPKPFDMATGDLVCEATLVKVEMQMAAFAQYLQMIKSAPLDQVRYRG